MLLVLTRHLAGNYYSEQLYRALDMSRDMGVTATSDYYSLPHEAYLARRASREYRLAFAGDVIEQILEAGAMEQQGWVHRAEALHVVTVPMVGESRPDDLVELMSPAVAELIHRRRDHPELHRYCALLLRTMSLAGSKKDDYIFAFDLMNRAHAQLVTAGGGQSAIHLAEAWQQVYLQECGQLARNVEAALLEQDRVLTELNLGGRLPNREIHRQQELWPMRIAARAAAEAGRRAVALISFVKTEEGLPQQIDPEKRRLSASTWFLTCSIMYLRALVLAGFIEMFCRNGNPGEYLMRVPAVWQMVVENDPASDGHHQPGLTTEHRMDLTRSGLLWSFLHGGLHPYKPRPYAEIRAGVPDFLSNTEKAGFDSIRAAQEIAAQRHNAGVLDNLAHVDTFRVLADHSGSGPGGFEAFLERRHSRLGVTVDVYEPKPKELRTIGSPTLRYLVSSARMVVKSKRYETVLQRL